MCYDDAEDTIKDWASYIQYTWQKHLGSFDDGKTPVFWAGFRGVYWAGFGDRGEEGIDTRKALADFIRSVNGFQLADTDWGAADSTDANNLEACPWDRQKTWWNSASVGMADTMAFRDVPHIIIALHKTLYGPDSFYRTVLYRAELRVIGAKMQSGSWKPKFEVRSIAVKGAPPDESGCALASEVKWQLESYAGYPVTVWCRPCTTLQTCGPKQEVEKKSPKAKCIGNCQNGQGTKTWADGSHYQGGWKNGLPDGQGTSTLASGNKYKGDYKNGFMDGQGNFTFASGNIYQGAWKNDTKDGQGTYTSPHRKIYEGTWKNDLMDGQGSKTWANGDKYQGEWKKGLQDGQGTQTWDDRKYEGGWKNGLEDGKGTYTYADGTKYKVWMEKGYVMKSKRKWWR